MPLIRTTTEAVDEIVRDEAQQPLQDITRRAEEEQNSLMLEPIPWETKFEPQIPTPEQSKPQLSLATEPADTWFTTGDILCFSKTPREQLFTKTRRQAFEGGQQHDGMQLFQEFDFDEDMAPLTLPFASMR